MVFHRICLHNLVNIALCANHICRPPEFGHVEAMGCLFLSKELVNGIYIPVVVYKVGEKLEK